jgi:hypothetical protein
MNQRVYHGTITPSFLANALMSAFNRGNWRVQRAGDGEKIIVQIATHQRAMSGGSTALSVILQSAEDGVLVSIGEQAWMGIAASLGTTAISVLANPWSIINRLDDLASDVENLQMTDEVWKVLDNGARSQGATFELSDRLRRLVCAYCDTANPVGTPHCIACGAPLGSEQPHTCKKCGFVVRLAEMKCPNCGAVL